MSGVGDWHDGGGWVSHPVGPFKIEEMETQQGHLGKTRVFDTGATRDSDADKIDPEGFLSPQVIERFSQYMHKHRKQSDGQLRASDNWQKGITKEAYMKSMFRHFLDVWKNHRNLPAEDLEESLCAMMFNVQGYLYEVLNDRNRTGGNTGSGNSGV